jgi:enoyl-CoA hydratase/carnithine racemase
LRCEAKDGIALVTLDRPDRHNAVDLATAAELSTLWRDIRMRDDINVIVLTGSGDRAFCTGIDRDATAGIPQPSSPFCVDDPLHAVGPKANDLWKPVIAAVNGMACGGAFYFLGESEFIIAAAHATFFDPHTTYGMVSAYEAISMAQRMPYGEVMRMSLMGTAERLTAQRAYETGLVSEVVPGPDLLKTALRTAAVIASYPTEAVQGTVRAVWSAHEAARAHALAHAPHLIALGSLPLERQAELFTARRRDFRVR